MLLNEACFCYLKLFKLSYLELFKLYKAFKGWPENSWTCQFARKWPEKSSERGREWLEPTKQKDL